MASLYAVFGRPSPRPKPGLPPGTTLTFTTETIDNDRAVHNLTAAAAERSTDGDKVVTPCDGHHPISRGSSASAGEPIPHPGSKRTATVESIDESEFAVLNLLG
jgi:hypothetical protein